MIEVLEKLKKEYELPEEQIIAIRNKIIANAVRNIRPVENPTAIIIGGQPGSGKSEIQGVEELNFAKNIVICNADNFRDAHPLATLLKKNYPQLYPELTVPFAHRWAQALQHHCITNSFNYILETTLRDGNAINNTIKTIKDAGFKTRLDALAVNEKLSLLGIELRFEKMLAEEDSGRMVTKEAHDLRYKAIPDALRVIANAGQLDDLNIYARNVIVSGDKNKRGIYMIAQNPNNPVGIYLQERNRNWTSLEQDYFKSKFEEVINMKIKRNAPEEDISRFMSNWDISKSRGRKL